MIKEAYCSYEISKLLREKGFDEECFGAYTETNHNVTMFTGQIKNSEYGISMYTAPTHQMACAWLREIYYIFIEIGTSIDLNGNYHYRYSVLNKECNYVRKGYTDFDWKYEDAVESALKYSLENLL
jgi:hypothetical protein